MKRKYATRSSWKRIVKRDYRELYLETTSFTGYVTRLDLIRVTNPLSVRYSEQEIQIVGDGYVWLQQFPAGQKHVITTMFNAHGQIVQVYVDICLRHGRDTTGIFWDDLMLDLVLLPSGECFVLDAEELELARETGVVNQDQYAAAWKETKILQDQIRTNKLLFQPLARVHHDLLGNV
ncbi:DUF402 domain-containing protein [Exiguobacterium sp. RIT594]|uniref:DUF402 domain-containing protein n=1 Tax=Exiguobacterium sp. RIT594 TaxID=2282449 RepID=UPI000DF76FFE|nr:DUF402 domain-containing protein [Exiguobacterium sp. RIT594]RDB34001.1 DUF402 domain-containing protein [Exiguobacterium sp. RIT594]